MRTGRLKIILGYAAGVGKTFRMLVEGQQRRREGVDVVVGYFEPHGRKDTIAQTEGLELIPRRLVEYRGHVFEEMDTEAILERKPELCLVDEFPHTNVPGTGREKRWEDVLVLQEAGIDVITTMNIQHLESLNDQMREITGIRVRETIPDWVVKRADEIMFVDLTPQALVNRLERGVVYAPEKAQKARENFFKETTLTALREMALRQAAHEVDARLVETAPASGPDRASMGTSNTSTGSQAPEERILIHITDSPATAALIRRGRRVADYLKAECFAVHVLPLSEGAAKAGVSAAVEQHLDFARKLHIETRVIEGEEEAQALVEFAHRNGVTQIFLARPAKTPLPFLPKRQLVMKVIDQAKNMQVTVVADRRKNL